MVRTATLACALSISVLAAETYQQRPDVSGTWTLVESLTNSSRGGPGATGEMVRTSVTTTGGAAFNCGSECVITLKGATLTVDHAQLADYPGKDSSKPTPAITFRLDGQEAVLADTFSPSRTLLAKARWVGDTIEIVTGSEAPVSRSQRLSMEGTGLVVTTTTQVASQPGLNVVRQRYERK